MNDEQVLRQETNKVGIYVSFGGDEKGVLFKRMKVEFEIGKNPSPLKEETEEIYGLLCDTTDGNCVRKKISFVFSMAVGLTLFVIGIESGKMQGWWIAALVSLVFLSVYLGYSICRVVLRKWFSSSLRKKRLDLIKLIRENQAAVAAVHQAILKTQH